tara:strand:+ start:8046 stop:8558 length:513 start_codon:yes stop_codon:yes gene_type:complete
MSAPKWNRKVHRVGALLVAAPALVILVTGLVLQLKKDWAWVQPATVSGSTTELAISWERVLEIAGAVPEAKVETWADIDRLDVRPSKGMLKVRCENGWEVQIDTLSGAVLSSEQRRSDWLESLHDGSWFSDKVKLLVFLPAGILLLILWGTGVYLWLLPHLVRRRRKVRS